MDFHWAWRSPEWGNLPQCVPRSISPGHQCIGTPACEWSGPHIAAARSVVAAAVGPPGTCSSWRLCLHETQVEGLWWVYIDSLNIASDYINQIYFLKNHAHFLAKFIVGYVGDGKFFFKSNLSQNAPLIKFGSVNNIIIYFY